MLTAIMFLSMVKTWITSHHKLQSLNHWHNRASCYLMLVMNISFLCVPYLDLLLQYHHQGLRWFIAITIFLLLDLNYCYVWVPNWKESISIYWCFSFEADAMQNPCMPCHVPCMYAGSNEQIILYSVNFTEDLVQSSSQNVHKWCAKCHQHDFDYCYRMQYHMLHAVTLTQAFILYKCNVSM